MNLSEKAEGVEIGKKYWGSVEQCIAVIVGIEIIVLISPLIIETIIRPFGLWDYFTIWDVMGIAPENLYDSKYIPSLLKELFFTSTFIYRPVSMFYYYIFVRFLGGNFWILLLLKWASKFLTVYVLYLFNKKIGNNKSIFLLVCSFLLFHTAIYEIMTFSVDGYLACSSIILSYYIYARMIKYNSFNIKYYSNKEYILLLFIFFVVSGIKELSVIIIITTVILFSIICFLERTITIRLIPLYMILFFSAYRILKIASVRLNDDNQKSINYINIFIDVFKRIFESEIAGGLLAGVILIALGFGIYSFFRIKKRERYNNMIFGGYLFLTILGMAVFTSISTEQLALRYIIPICFLFGQLLLLLCQDCKLKINGGFLILSIIIPVICASNIYGQYLAYSNQFQEQQVYINKLLSEKEKDESIDIIISGHDEWGERFFSGAELQTSIRIFFSYLGNMWYNTPNYSVKTVEEYNNSDSQEGLWMTTYNLQEAQALLSKAEIESIDTVKIEGGTISRIYGLLKAVDKKLGLTSTISYDVGASTLRNDSYWNLYKIKVSDTNENKISAEEVDIVNFENYTANTSYQIESLPETIFIPKGECAKLYVNIDKGNGAHNYISWQMTGEIQVMSGEITYGFSDDKGNMYVGKTMGQNEKEEFDISYLAKSDVDNLQFFIFIPSSNEDISFKIGSLQLQSLTIQVNELQNIPYYGSFY